MAIRRLRFTIDSGRVLSNSTSQFVLGSHTVTSTPAGNESLTGFITNFSVKSTIYCNDSAGAHGARIWYKLAGGKYNPSTGLEISTGTNGVSAANGIIYGSAFSAAITYDVSGANWRCLITPPDSTTYLWIATHEVEYVSMSVL